MNELLFEIATVLDEMANATASESRYAAGVVDGLRSAATLVKNYATDVAKRTSDSHTESFSRRRQNTQLPVIEMLKVHGSMSVAEIVQEARAGGLDLLRPSVQSVLDKLRKRGLVTFHEHRWHLNRSTEGLCKGEQKT